MRYMNEVEKWWWSDETTRMPGIVVPFFGAGVSIDQPTALPSGLVLTKTLAEHLLDSSSAETLLSVFEENRRVTGRTTPRLEHVLSIAIRANVRAARLLDIFRNVTPNRAHHILAEEITRRRGWAVTTNFDECVEQASGWSIPVHLFDPDTCQIRVLYGPHNSDWGLIKLHGTIGEGARRLGATIERLTPGLAGPAQQLLDRAFSTADFVVVAGYSGSDHFDVNRYLQGKLGRPYEARLLWLQHGSDHSRKAMFPSSQTFHPSPETRGPDSFQTAFNGVKSFSGNTSDLLGDVLGCFRASFEAMEAKSWSDSLKELYTPSQADRLRTGALFGASIGLTALIDISVPLLRYELEDENVSLLEQATSFELKGHWRSARMVLRHHQKVSGENTALLIATNLRRSGRPLQALISLLLFCNLDEALKVADQVTVSATDPPALRRRIEIHNCLLDMWRLVRNAKIGRTRPVSFVIGALIEAVNRATSCSGSNAMSAETESDWQLGQLRAIAYGTYSLNDAEAGWLWRAIEAEMEPPDFITHYGPLTPGFYLNSATTNAELDRIATLFEVRLAFADVLIAGIQNNYLDSRRTLLIRIRNVFTSKDEWAWRLRSEFMIGCIFLSGLSSCNSGKHARQPPCLIMMKFTPVSQSLG